MIYLAGVTRWKAERDELKCFLNNIHFMRQAADDLTTNLLQTNLINRLRDDKLVEMVQHEVEKLDPICCFIDAVQSRDCNLAEATHNWLQLKPIPQHHCDWLKRDEMICVLPALIAYCLHPTLKGQLLSQGQKMKVEVAIYENGRGEQTLVSYKKFQQGEGLFGDTDAIVLKPVEYWELMAVESINLSKIALTYVSLPASTASLERIFSMWAFVHDKSRNRLTNERSEKLLYCYHTLKTLSVSK